MSAAEGREIKSQLNKNRSVSECKIVKNLPKNPEIYSTSFFGENRKCKWSMARKIFRSLSMHGPGLPNPNHGRTIVFHVSNIKNVYQILFNLRVKPLQYQTHFYAC